MSPLRERLA